MFANKIILQKQTLKMQGLMPAPDFFSQNLLQQVLKMAKKGFFGHILTIN